MKLCVMLWNDIWLIVSENMVQMNIFGSVREEITGDWRKLCIGELHILRVLQQILILLAS